MNADNVKHLSVKKTVFNDDIKALTALSLIFLQFSSNKVTAYCRMNYKIQCSSRLVRYERMNVPFIQKHQVFAACNSKQKVGRGKRR